MNSQIEISDKGQINHFLNLNIRYSQESGTLSIDLEQYIDKLLKDFDMKNCHIKKTPTPTSANLYDKDIGNRLTDKSVYLSDVGRLVYLATKGRYDIMFIVSRLSTFMQSPTDYHLSQMKHVFRYLKYSKKYKIYYQPNNNDLVVFCDADFGNTNSSKSITGVCTVLFDCIINCMSKTQSCLSTSTTQAETNAICEAVYDTVYVRDLLSELSHVNLSTVRVFNDKQPSLASIKSAGDFIKNRHYKSKINLIREQVQKNNLNLQCIESRKNLADVFTKAVSSICFFYL